MRRTLADGQMNDVWFGAVPCGLDAPFNAMHTCSGVDLPTAFYVGGGVERAFIIGADTIITTAWKGFSGGTEHEEFWVADIGRLEEGTGEAFAPVTRLVYAVVGGVEYGEIVLPTAVEQMPEAPPVLGIASAYPNPFRTQITVLYHVEHPEQVVIEVYNTLGQRVLAQATSYKAAGVHQYVVEGSGLSAGLYFIRMQTASGRQAVHAVTHLK